MSRTDYLGWLGTIALGAVVGLLVMRPLVGERWFGLYGLAAVAIPVALAGAVVLARRSRAVGRSPWRAALVAVPLLVLAVVQIGYWTAFFSLGAKAVPLVLLRAVVLDAVGSWLTVAGAALSGLILWLFVSAARDDPSTNPGAPQS